MNKHEFVMNYMDTWGEADTLALLEQGFEPVLVTDGVNEKWVWRLKPENHLTQRAACATLSPAAFTSRLSGSRG